jgi:hypothetical protein
MNPAVSVVTEIFPEPNFQTITKQQFYLHLMLLHKLPGLINALVLMRWCKHPSILLGISFWGWQCMVNLEP